MDVWTEAWNWSWRWAKRLHNEAPSLGAGDGAHFQHRLDRLATDEVVSTFPEHLRLYDLDPRAMVHDSMAHYCEAMDNPRAA